MGEQQKIIMNFNAPPSLEDVQVLATQMLDQMPDDLIEHTENLIIQVEDFADETLLSENGVDDPFEMLSLFKSGKEISPGVQKKNGDDEDHLILYRRAILDLWCESGDELSVVIRLVMIEEIARAHEFHDDQIEEMIETHFQGML